MLSHKNNGNLLIFDLPNDYSVEVTSKYIRSKDIYYISIRIQRNDIENIVPIEENIQVKSDRESIRRDIAILITKKLTEGYFMQPIKEYEYLVKCMDKGNEIFEKERLGLS